LKSLLADRKFPERIIRKLLSHDAGGNYINSSCVGLQKCFQILHLHDLDWYESYYKEDGLSEATTITEIVRPIYEALAVYTVSMDSAVVNHEAKEIVWFFFLNGTCNKYLLQQIAYLTHYYYHNLAKSRSHFWSLIKPCQEIVINLLPLCNVDVLQESVKFRDIGLDYVTHSAATKRLPEVLEMVAVDTRISMKDLKRKNWLSTDPGISVMDLFQIFSYFMDDIANERLPDVKFTIKKEQVKQMALEARNQTEVIMREINGRLETVSGAKKME